MSRKLEVVLVVLVVQVLGKMVVMVELFQDLQQ